MARFRYRAVSSDGAMTEDVTEAPSRDAVISRLRDAGHFPVRISALEGDPDSAGGDASPAGEARGRQKASSAKRRRGSRISRERLAVATRELQTLLAAGLTLDRALGVLAETRAVGAVGPLMSDLRAKVREGEPLSLAMAEHPETFSSFYRAMTHAGEAGNSLAEALGRLAGYLERAEALLRTLRSSLIYPTILLLTAFVSVIAIMTFVVPQFELLFRQSGANLPWLTHAVLRISAFLRDFGWLIAVVLLAMGFALHLHWRQPQARRRRDRFLLAVPAVGPLIAEVEVERFARALAALLGNGVHLPAALALAEGTIGNQALAGAVAGAAEDVRQGRRLADALAGTAFPPLAVQLIRVGEEAGNLGGLLLTLADLYAAETDAALKRLVAVVEPLLIVGIGLFVAVVVISFLTAVVGVHDLAF
ncbi:MAG: type II secretion system F family protein [Rhodospirillales bacterium]|nr:type II secretion system F family protein [Rhodospirillales bacterium]